MKEDTILEKKDRSSVTTYLGFIQNNIARMATNSANTKAFVAVVYTIYASVLAAIEVFEPYWWIGLIITALGIVMDAYYLAFERMYRTKYNKFLNKLNKNILDEAEIYNMNPKNTDLKYEVIAEMIDCVRSFSIWGFYFLFLVVTILLKFI